MVAILWWKAEKMLPSLEHGKSHHCNALLPSELPGVHGHGNAVKKGRTMLFLPVEDRVVGQL